MPISTQRYNKGINMTTLFTLNVQDLSITPKGTVGISVTQMSTEQKVFCDTFPTRLENTYAATVVLSTRLDMALIMLKDEGSCNTLELAVDAVLRDALDRVEVHPCDNDNDNVKFNGLSDELKSLYQARHASLKSNEPSNTQIGPLPLEFLDNLPVKCDDYQPDVGELMFTQKGSPVYFSHTQHESYATGFVCCDDKNLPSRGNYAVFEKLIPQAINWTEKLNSVKNKLGRNSEKLEKALMSLTEE
jgi:hypothetical protein